MTGFPLLSILIFLPIAAALACVVLPLFRFDPLLARPLALGAALIALVLSIVPLFGYPAGSSEMHYVETARWIPQLGIGYHLALDGLNVLLVPLTALLTVVALLASWEAMAARPAPFAAFVLLLEGTVIGALTALDLILYFVFWELVLVPMYLLIAAYGGPRRGYAALKFFLYTSVGSLLMLLAILVTRIYSTAGSFDLIDLRGAPLSPGLQGWLFLAFALAFAIKLPLVPLHTWLPDAYTQAPITVLVLATMLVKVGAYSYLRFAAPLFPVAAAELMPWLAVLATVGIIYGGLIASVQRDMVRLLAYSSVSHLGFIGLGIFALQRQAIQGSLLQMVNHGLSTGALFLIVAMLMRRTGSSSIAAHGGLARRWPVLAGCFTLAAFSSLGLPGLNGFVGEFLILLGAFQTQRWLAVVASFGVLLAAIYLLRLYRRTMHGEERAPDGTAGGDLTRGELLTLAPLLVLIVWLGVYPAPFLRLTSGAADQVVEAVTPSAASTQHSGTQELRNSGTPPGRMLWSSPHPR